MFDELNVYNDNGHFFFKDGDVLSKICNAPEKAGVYLIYQLKNGKVDLVYIGASGAINQDGSFKSQLLKSSITSAYEELKKQFLLENRISAYGIDALDIYWYVTFNKKIRHIPTSVEGILLQKYFDIFGSLPPWNKGF